MPDIDFAAVRRVRGRHGSFMADVLKGKDEATQREMLAVLVADLTAMYQRTNPPPGEGKGGGADYDGPPEK